MAPPVEARKERDALIHLASKSVLLTEADLAYSNDWFIRLRWVAGTGVLLGSLGVSLIPGVSLPIASILIIGVCILLYNLGFAIIARMAEPRRASSTAYRRLAYAQMILDWLAITLLVQFTGGVVSPLTFFYVFHVVIACMLFNTRTSFAFTFLAIFLFTLVLALEYFSIAPYYPFIGWSSDRVNLYQDPFFVITLWASFTFTLLILTYLATGRSERLRQREAEVLALSESLKISSARLQALNDSAQTVNSTLELSQVLNHLVANTAQAMGVRGCAIRLLDKNAIQLEPAAVFGLSQKYLARVPIEVERSPLDREVLAGKVINIPEVRQTTLLRDPEWALQEGIRSMVSAPLIGKNRPLGVLRAYAEQPERFTVEDEAFLLAIAAQGSTAIENALAYQTIEMLDATKAAFIRVFTHELRSPVSVIRSLLQTLLSGYAAEVNPQQRDILERAVRRVDFLRKLIDDLLDLATGRAPQETVQAEPPAALEAVLENVVQRFELPAHENGLTLKWQIDPDGVSLVQAPAESLDRIFNNLVSNAVKYTPPGGEVRVSLRRLDREVVVEVEDTGIGIPKEAMADLFEEFYRAPNARSIEREGTGLGLAIVRETTRNLGGQVEVQSQVGVGTRFTVTLPRVEAKSAVKTGEA